MTAQPNHLTTAERSKHHVLVPDAHAIGMIAVIRSLGRAGYTVHACASKPEALGLSSSFASHQVICPAYDDRMFLPWLSTYVAQHGIRTVVPSEGFLLGVRPAFETYAAMMPIPSNPNLVYGSLSKSAVIARLLETPETAAYLPPTLLWSAGEPLPVADQLEALGLPLFVKGDGADDTVAGDNIVVREESADGAHKRLIELSGRYRRVLVQGFVPGQGTGAYFLIHKGEIVQEFMNRCIHEVPHTGGFCSLRESWWHEPMMADARVKIRHLGWEGVAMIEYRWDPDTDQFWFIELNARFWAALHVALYAGVDFPKQLLDLRHGAPVARITAFPLGLQVRYTVPFEVGYVMSRWKDKSLPFGQRVRSVVGWFARFLNPTIRSDLAFPGDRKLYFSAWRTFLSRMFGPGDA